MGEPCSQGNAAVPGGQALEQIPASGLGSGNVLIVEDDEHIAELLRYWFCRAGFVTRIAADGLSACSMVEQERPDVILLDLMLPGLNGREVCRLIRRHAAPRIATIPIIMLTALAAPADRASGLLAGADLYITKPIRSGRCSMPPAGCSLAAGRRSAKSEPGGRRAGGWQRCCPGQGHFLR